MFCYIMTFSTLELCTVEIDGKFGIPTVSIINAVPFLVFFVTYHSNISKWSK